MINYFNKMELISKDRKYYLYYNKEDNQYYIYDGFNIKSFSLKDLGDYLYSNRNSHMRNIKGIYIG